MSTLPLSPAQQTLFQTFGYLSFPTLLQNEIPSLTQSFEQVFHAHGGGHHNRPHDGAQRSCIVPFIDQSEHLSALLDHPAIHNILTAILGPDFTYLGSDGNYYVGDTTWHSDGWHRDHLYIKLAFYLDPLTRDTGALRVIPGSHHPGDQFADNLHHQITKSQQTWNLPPSAVPSIALETNPGDVLLFHHNLKHASFGGSASRRMFTINAASHFPDHLLPELKTYIAGHARFWLDRHYGPAMLATATPQRHRHLEQVLANDAHLAPLSAQARQQMPEPARG